MESITFENLPKAVNILTKEVYELKQLLLSKNNDHPIEANDKLFTVNETADFLSLAVPTIYSMASRGEIPVMKRSKRLYFSRLELLEYIKAGRKPRVIVDPEINLLRRNKKGLYNGK